MKLKIGIFLIFSSVFFDVLSMIPIPDNFIEPVEGKGADFKWLQVPEVVNSVLIVLGTGEKEPKIKLGNEEEFNFAYAKMEGGLPPLGLFYWEKSLVQECHTGFYSGGRACACPKVGDNYQFEGKDFNSEGKPEHPSPSLWGLKVPIKSVVTGSNELKDPLRKLAGNLKALKEKLGVLSSKLILLKDKLKTEKPAVVVQPSKPVTTPAHPGTELTEKENALVDKIFLAAKKKIGEVPCASASEDPSASTKYSFATKTQSIVHLDWRNIFWIQGKADPVTNQCQNEDGYKAEYEKTFKEETTKDKTRDVGSVIKDLIKNYTESIKKDNFDKLYPGSDVSKITDEYLKIAENALANEAKYNKDYYVFYHGYAGGFKAILHEIYQFLYAWGMMKENQPLALRFFDKDMSQSYPQSIKENFEAFHDLTKRVVINPTTLDPMTKCWYCDGKSSNPEYGQSVDLIPRFSEQLLSVNLALFGNNTRQDESSFVYFEKARSISGPVEGEIPEIINKISAQTEIENFKQKINGIIETYIKIPTTGVLLQIFIKKEDIDQVAYWALDGGYTLDMKIDGKEGSIGAKFSNLQQFTASISNLLKLYLSDPLQLHTIISEYKQKIHLKPEYLLGIDTLQARIWLASPYLYDPNKTKIIRYSLDNKKVFNKLHDDLTAVFAELIKEFIAKKIKEDIKSVPKFFKKLNDWIDEEKKKGSFVQNEISWLPAFAQVQTV